MSPPVREQSRRNSIEQHLVLPELRLNRRLLKMGTKQDRLLACLARWRQRRSRPRADSDGADTRPDTWSLGRHRSTP